MENPPPDIQGDSDGLSADDLFTILANRHRRIVLSYLRATDEATVTELAHKLTVEECLGDNEAKEGRFKAMHLALDGVHLPVMADAGLVAYDESTGVVTLPEESRDYVAWFEQSPLPISDQSATPAGADRPRQHRIRVLYVGDEQTAGRVTDGVPAANDAITVVTERRADAALERIARGDVDCVVTDTDLPATDGIEFVEAIQESPLDVPVIVFTGEGSEAVASDAFVAGANGYLQRGRHSDQYDVLADRITDAVQSGGATADRQVFDAVHDGVLVYERETGTIVDVNDACCRLLGYRRSKLVDADLDALGVTAFPDPSLEERGSEGEGVDWRVETSDGGECHVVATPEPVTLDGTDFAVLSIKDVTEFRTKARAARESNRAFSSLLSNLPGIAYRCRNEPGWPMEFVSDGCEDVVGYDATAIESGSVSWGGDVVHPDDRETVRETVLAALEEGESFTMTYRVRRADGTDGWVWEQGRAIDTPADEPDILEGFITDVTEQKARERELEQYEKVTETVQDGICVLNADSEFVMVNDTFAAMTGYERDELLGAHASLVRPDSLNDRFEEIQESLAAGSELETVEMEIENVHGQQRVIDARYALFPREDGAAGRVGVWRDITDRKERERERARFEQAVESAGHSIYMTDAEGTITYVNPTFEETTGYSRTEVIGETPKILDSGEHSDAYFERLWSTIQAGERWEEEIVNRRKTGELYTALQIITPVTDDDGAIDRFVAIQMDITERKERERELEQFHSLTQAANDVIVTMDSDGTVQSVNPAVADVLGYEPEELMGESLTKIIPDRLADEHTAGVQRYLDTGNRTIDWTYYELPGERRDGSEVMLAVSFGDTEYGGEHYFTGILRDISERKERERELAEEREKYSTLVEQSTDGVVLVQDGEYSFVNRQFEAITGYDEAELLGMPFDEVFDPEYQDLVRERYQKRLAGDQPPSRYDVQLLTADGEHVDVELSVSLVQHEGGPAALANFRDITDRKRRERQLESLNDVSQRLMASETEGAIWDVTVDAAVDILGLDHAAVERYDEETGQLRPVAYTDAIGPLDDEALFGAAGAVTWRAYVDNEQVVVDETDVEPGAALANAIVLPLGKYGVFVAGGSEPDTVTAVDRDLARILAAHAQAALDRVDREHSLRDRTATLETQNERLERMNRLNDVIRELTQTLISASTRGEIERDVCAYLANTGPYRFAWIASRDAADGAVRPKEWAGAEEGYLDSVELTTAADDDALEPAQAAFETGERQVVDAVLGDPPLSSWRQEALERGYRSAIAVPIDYKGTCYGVLAIYANEPRLFDRLEQEVLEELGETIGYAIDAVEQRAALTTDRVVELTFHVRDTTLPISRLAKLTGAAVELEGVVQGDDRSPRVFVTLRDGTVDDELTAASGSVGIDDLRLVAGDDSERLVEYTAVGQCLVPAVIEQGAAPRALVSDGEGFELTVELPANRDVREFVTALESKFAETELRGRRELDRPIQTSQGIGERIRDLLTDRQLEVLELAYFSGYFEWPRENSGQEVADGLGVSQPTFNRHLRIGQRKLFELLFGDGSAAD